jgi:hypothetical protein
MNANAKLAKKCNSRIEVNHIREREFFNCRYLLLIIAAVFLRWICSIAFAVLSSRSVGAWHRLYPRDAASDVNSIESYVSGSGASAGCAFLA